MNAQRLLECALLHSATEAVKTYLAPTAACAAAALKVTDRAAWTSMNVKLTPAVCTQTALTSWGRTGAPATAVLPEMD